MVTKVNPTLLPPAIIPAPVYKVAQKTRSYQRSIQLAVRVSANNSGEEPRNRALYNHLTGSCGCYLHTHFCCPFFPNSTGSSSTGFTTGSPHCLQKLRTASPCEQTPASRACFAAKLFIWQTNRNWLLCLEGVYVLHNLCKVLSCFHQAQEQAITHI